MKILMPEPKYFFCETDEELFFSWLKRILAVKEHQGSSSGLELDIITPIGREDFYDLVGLMSRYGLDKSCLRPLCEDNPDDWFRDKKNYWYDDVYVQPA